MSHTKNPLGKHKYKYLPFLTPYEVHSVHKFIRGFGEMANGLIFGNDLVCFGDQMIFYEPVYVTTAFICLVGMKREVFGMNFKMEVRWKFIGSSSAMNFEKFFSESILIL